MGLRRWTKLCVSMLYFGLAGIAAVVRRWSRQVGCGEVVVLTYHQVLASQAESFRRHVQLFQSAGQLVWADFEPALDRHRRYLALTFDDGFAEAFRVVLPILQERRACSTWFVPTGYLGGPAGWITDSSHPNYGASLLRVADIQASDPATVRFGSHTDTHQRLSAVNVERLCDELLHSQHALERMATTAVDLISLPYGDYSADVLDRCREAGYRRVFANVPILQLASNQKLVRGRVPCDITDSSVELWLKARGGYNWMAVIPFVKSGLAAGRCWFRSRIHIGVSNGHCRDRATSGERPD